MSKVTRVRFQVLLASLVLVSSASTALAVEATINSPTKRQKFRTGADVHFGGKVSWNAGTESAANEVYAYIIVGESADPSRGTIEADIVVAVNVTPGSASGTFTSRGSPDQLKAPELEEDEYHFYEFNLSVRPTSAGGGPYKINSTNPAKYYYNHVQLRSIPSDN